MTLKIVANLTTNKGLSTARRKLFKSLRSIRPLVFGHVSWCYVFCALLPMLTSEKLIVISDPRSVMAKFKHSEH
jgi:hypothetical protein